MEWIDDVLENIDKYSLDTQYIAVMGDRDAKEYTKALQDKLSVKDMVNGFLDLAVSNVWIREVNEESNLLYDSVENKEWVKPTDFKWNEKPLCDLTEEELTELVNGADLHFYDWTCNSLEINNGKAKVVPYFLNENAYSYILEDINEGRLSESKMKEVVNQWKQEQKTNEVYLQGYFYLPTNSDNLKEALKVLEEIGFNMDNANAIELRDNEGNTIETMFDNILADIERD